jgi:peptidyl-prolyl cis-trans isomerase A (cyclophilin A)
MVGHLLVACGLAAGCGSASSQDPPVPRAQAEGPQPPKPGPDQYWVKFQTTRGDVIIEVNRKWSPYGADRFYELVKSGFYDGCRFFRVLPAFVAQFGINGDPKVNAEWKDKNIPDDKFKLGDPTRQSNARGTLTFAKSGLPNSRTTQLFISTGNNARLNQMGFTPFGKVLQGMAAVDSLYDGYREEPQGSADRIEAEGNAYLDRAFPKLDSIKKATLLEKKPDLPKKDAAAPKTDAPRTGDNPQKDQGPKPTEPAKSPAG